MTTYSKQDVIKARVVERRKSEPSHLTVPGEIVSVNGATEHPTKPGYVWVIENFQSGAAAPALNINGVLPIEGTPVILRKIPSKDLFKQREIVGINTESVTGASGTPLQQFVVSVHGANHQWPTETEPGPDPVNVYASALMPLKAVYDGVSMVARVQPFVYYTTGGRRYFPGQAVDLTSLVPATAGRAVRALLYLDSDLNTIQTAVSGEVIAALTEPPLPAVPVGDFPSAYFTLTNGQTTLTAATYLEGRQFPNPYTASSGGGAVDAFDVNTIMTDADGQIMVDADGNVMVEV